MIKEMPQRQEASDVTQYSISQVARLYDISRRTLRFYEERGLLRPARIGAARYYSDRDLSRLEVVLTGKRLGFSLAVISDLIDSRVSETPKPASLSETLSRREIAPQIDRLSKQRDTLDEAIAELRALANVQRPARAALWGDGSPDVAQD